MLFANTDWYVFNFRRPLIKELIASGFDVMVLAPRGMYFERLRGEGIKCIEAPLNRRGYVGIADAISLIRLFLIYRRERPAAVHHFTMHAALFGMLCAKLACVPHRINAITGMGYFFTREERQIVLLGRLVRPLLRWLFTGKNTHVIVQNKVDYSFFLKHRVCSPKNLHLIYGSGINVHDYEVRNRGVKRGETRVLMASRLLVDKGVREYIEASQSHRFKESGVRFFLAGEPDSGNPSSISQQEITSWKNLANFTYLGYIEEMSELMQTVDIFVLPSYREGLPRSLLEAAACELPIVTTDVPGCNEVVIHEVNGLLVPARSVEPLGEAIEKLVLAPSLQKQYGRVGRERVAELFSEAMVLEKTLKIYKSFNQKRID